MFRKVGKRYTNRSNRRVFVFIDFKKNIERCRKSLVDFYIEVWKEPPWEELFWTSENVNEIINSALEKKDFVGRLVVKSPEEEVVGFVWGYKLPLEKFTCLKDYYPKEDNTEEKTYFYLADLAVKADYRNSGIGTFLLNKLTEEARKLGYEYAVLTTDVNAKAYNLYIYSGFEDLNIRDPRYPTRTYMMKSLR